ncbi:MAG: hypothetical protein Q8R15_01625 [Candidatus Micrarchaeota archaeon]|nr:hypothetical protein [Candidatus Micrarchaeota archaeon]
MGFSKLAYLAQVKRKINAGAPVSVGVFCTGNSDRSPLARAALERRFRELGYGNVNVFSFGVTAQSGAEKGSSPRTVKHAADMGYDLSRHRATALVDALPNIKKADLIFGISPSHLAFFAEAFADDVRYRGLSQDVLHKGWSLVGFANKKEWTRRWRLLGGGIARGLALKDPHGLPENEAGEKEWRRCLKKVESTAIAAADRLVERKRD